MFFHHRCREQQRQRRHIPKSSFSAHLGLFLLIVTVFVFSSSSSSLFFLPQQLLPQAVVVVHALAAASAPNKKKYYGGAGIGRLVLDETAAVENAWQCHYDMVLCERIQFQDQQPKDDDSGGSLFVPRADLPRLHLCRVLNLGPGREEENGRIAPNSVSLLNLKVGDVVIAKNPWGIGPKDEETSEGKKLSYMRSQDIAAVITGGGLVPDEDE